MLAQCIAGDETCSPRESALAKRKALRCYCSTCALHGRDNKKDGEWSEAVKCCDGQWVVRAGIAMHRWKAVQTRGERERGRGLKREKCGASGKWSLTVESTRETTLARQYQRRAPIPPAACRLDEPPPSPSTSDSQTCSSSTTQPSRTGQ